MTNSEFLKWLADRLVNVYHENPYTDFVLHLNTLAIHESAVSELERARDIAIAALHKGDTLGAFAALTAQRDHPQLFAQMVFDPQV